MNALERLREATEPLWSDTDYEMWQPLSGADLRALTWKPSVRLRFIAVFLKRVRVAGTGWSLRHMFRATQSSVLEALRFATPEMEWFKQYPTAKNGRKTKWGAS